MSSKTTINIKNKFDRVVVLVDMDCFYCQVEEKLNPEIRGKPIAVVQYNPWQGGGIIAVNYPARAEGVTRHMRGDEAKQHCPDIELPQVPQVRGKADLTRYREAGKEVADVLKSFTPLLERASIDEAYLDITERVLTRIREMNEGKFQLLPDKLANTFAVGYENIGEFVKKLSNTFDNGTTAANNSPEKLEYKKSDIKLLVGASIVNEIRTAVKDKTGYECSAGIAHNKILAKLTAGFHKPNKQTILPIDSIAKLYETLPVKKVKGLGGKLGDQVCEVLKIKFMSELVQFPESLLQQHFDERMGSWMYLMARGVDLEAVTVKLHSKSIGCCKRFPGKNAITGIATLNHWLNELATEVTERLEKDLDENNRTAKQLTVSYSQQIENVDVSSTRSIPLVAYDVERIAVDSLEAIKRNTERFFKANSTTVLNNAIKFLGISAGKFEPNAAGKGVGIKQMFQSYSSKAANGNEGPSGSGHKNDLEKPKDGLSETKSTSIESPTVTVPEVPTPVPNPPKKDIRQLLQKQASLPRPPSIGNEKKIVPTNDDKDGLTKVDQFGQCGKVTAPEVVKQKKSIQHFLQPKTGVATPDVSSSEHEAIQPLLENEEKHSTMPVQSCGSEAVDQSSQECEKIANVKPPCSSSEALDTQDPLQGTHSEILDQAANQSIGVMVEKEREILPPADKKSPNYKETYAEFCGYIPEPAPLTVECSQCGKQIPEHEYVSHQDFHFALSLSQQQRDEFRNDLKSKHTSTYGGSSTAKGTKSPFPAKRPTPSVATNLSITRFLSKVSPESARLNNSETKPADDDMNAAEKPEHLKCPECGKLVHWQSMEEHKDYHVAKRLQQELNRVEPSSPHISSKPAVVLQGSNTNAGGSTAKRKRPGTGTEEVMSPAKQKLKPVSSYFTKL